jgi:hypothetical protein
LTTTIEIHSKYQATFQGCTYGYKVEDGQWLGIVSRDSGRYIQKVCNFLPTLTIDLNKNNLYCLPHSQFLFPVSPAAGAAVGQAVTAAVAAVLATTVGASKY